MTVLVIGLGLLFWGVLIAGIGSAFVLTFRTPKPDRYGYSSDPLIPLQAQRFVWALTLIAVLVVPIAAASGDLDGIFTSVPDGCWRVSSSTSVGFVPTGKGVSPIIISGKTYTPIACPNG